MKVATLVFMQLFSIQVCNIIIYRLIANLTDGDEHEVEDGDRAGQHVAGLVEDAPARGQRPAASYILELSTKFCKIYTIHRRPFPC